MIGTRSTPRDLVRMLKPEATDDECDFLLWERSCFPMGTVNQWFAQVRDALVVTTSQADRRPHAPSMASSAPTRSSDAGSSSSRSVAPTDSLPDAKGQEPT